MKRKLILIFPLLAMGSLYVGYQTFIAGSSQSSQEVMLAFEEELTFDDASMEGILIKIDFALRLAREEGDRDQQALILRRRAKLYRDLKRNENAREDLKLLLRDYEPEDRESIQTLSRLEFLAGNREHGLDLIETLLEKDPTDSGGLFNRADFRLAMAKDLLKECADICAEVMDDNSARLADSMTTMASARTHTDLNRARLMMEITKLFNAGSEIEKREYNEKAKLAREHLFSAFADYAAVLKNTNSTDAIASVLKILQMSGGWDDAADFATASIYHFARTNRMNGVEQVFAALHQAGLNVDANRLSRLFIKEGRTLSPAFIREMLRITYASEMWSSLPELNKTLLGFYPPGATSGSSKAERDSARSLANFYQGIASHHLGNHSDAVQKLGRYRSGSPRAKPFPDALLVAEDARARSASQVGGSSFKKVQLQALQFVLKNTDKASGLHWRALMKLQSDLGVNATVAEVTIAHVMAAFPTGSSEHESLWRQYGRRGMKDAFLSLDAVRNQLNQANRLVGEQTMSAYAYFQLAEQYVTEREWYGVLVACDKVFESVPYLPPAVRLYLKATTKLGLEERAIDLLIGQLEFAGPNAVDLDRLYNYRELFSLEQKLRLIDADPLGYGRGELIDSLLERGEYRQVLSALPDASTPSVSHVTRIQASEALLGLERYDEALLLLQQIPTDSEHYSRVFALLLETAIATEDTRFLDSAITNIVRPTQVVETDFMATLDTLLINGRIELASKVANFLDSSVATRSGQNMLRIGLIQILNEQYEEAFVTFERAYAYSRNGAATLGNMLLAVRTGEWSTLSRHLAEYEDERKHLNDESVMILALLHGRTEPVLEQLNQLSRSEQLDGIHLLLRSVADTLDSGTTALLEEFPSYVVDETREFISGTSESPHDPREILVLLLALQDKDWRVWLVQEMPRWSNKGSGMWASYLTAEALLRSSAFKQADVEITHLATRWEQFLPVWQLANRLQTSLPIGNDQLLTFAKRGWEVPDHPGSQSMRSKLDTIEELRNAGDIDQAFRKVRSALDSAPNNAALLYQLGMIHGERGNYEAALINLGRFVRRLPKAPRDAILPEIVEFFDEAVAAGHLAPELWRSSLTSFSTEFPYNGLIAIRYILSELKYEVQRNPTGSIFDALKRINQFKTRTSDAPINSLGAGSLEAWHQFYLELSPSLDEEFLREQLKLDPSAPEHWSMLTQCLYAQGRFAEADTLNDRLLSMVPDRLGLQLSIEKAIRHGESLSYVESLCGKLADVRHVDAATDPQVRFLLAKAKANGTVDEAEQGVTELGNLWRGIIQNDGGLPAEGGQAFTVAVGRAFGVSAMRLGTRVRHSAAQKAFTHLLEMPLSLAEKRLFATLSRIGPHRTEVALPPLAFTPTNPNKQREKNQKPAAGSKPKPSLD
ncbi:MAG: tetratricopeptide (TPR) repeat protein, partial [Planctomycetota bacterium]